MQSLEITSMSTTTSRPTRTNQGSTDTLDVNHPRHGDETKPSWKTTELFVYIAAVIGVLIASNAVGDANNDGGDHFAADKAWWFITLLTIGYLVSRGLAKLGARSRDVDPRSTR
jgi:hypothetical protein